MPESFPRRAVAGTIAALTTVVLTATACSPDPLPCDPTVTADSLGIATGSGLDAMPADRLERYLDLVEASGARWIRFDVDWSTIEPERGRSDWNGVDRVVAALRATTIKGKRLVVRPDQFRERQPVRRRHDRHDRAGG